MIKIRRARRATKRPTRRNLYLDQHSFVVILATGEFITLLNDVAIVQVDAKICVEN